jgi:hypothetical protein
VIDGYGKGFLQTHFRQKGQCCIETPETLNRHRFKVSYYETGLGFSFVSVFHTFKV